MKTKLFYLFALIGLIAANGALYDARACWGCAPGVDAWMCGQFGPVQVCDDSYLRKCGDDDGGEAPQCSPE